VILAIPGKVVSLLVATEKKMPVTTHCAITSVPRKAAQRKGSPEKKRLLGE
jgi:hypothetical protein